MRDIKLDKCLIVAVVSLVMTGILMVYSASNAVSRDQFGDSFHYLKKELLWCCVGAVLVVFATFLDYHNYQRLAWLILLLGGILLLLVYIPGVGIKSGGSTRWVKIFGITFQPVELAKLALIIYMASFLNHKTNCVGNFRRGVLPSLIVLFAFLALIYGQPDFGSVILMGSVAFSMLFVGGARIYQLALFGIASAIFLAFEIWREPYRMERWLTFLNPWADPDGAGYHIIQSYYAFGMGGALGRGLGAGVQKLHYLPTPHTDFIFSVIGEEMGFLGSLFVVILFMMIVWRGIRISLSAQDRFGSLLAVGISSLFGFQSAINIAVVTGALPTKGITLPFVSFGGSSLLVSLFSTGILLNISKSKC